MKKNSSSSRSRGGRRKASLPSCPNPALVAASGAVTDLAGAGPAGLDLDAGNRNSNNNLAGWLLGAQAGRSDRV